MHETAALRRTAGYTAVAVAASLGVVFSLPEAGLPMFFDPRTPLFGALVQTKLFFSTFTTLLLLVLLATYGRVYREFPNRFTLSLILFTVALLLHAVTSNPFLPLLLGFGRGVELGPFTYLPDLFTSVAVVILLYQSHK
ncbi:hypothetical protein [Haloferax sulfurifontis]|uniref:Uncharacterized protein n=2 Tax=Haloferax sulfurifontis TaxID=255616 RepID=M0I129_9EURY|nr:hypothetical protein [Haloferax sulfurifontis]ELZ90421.1 hypothetical protein C441_12751 [Haloferax sulfurifontis ATCC BAA-897]GGC71991.1 hypothetical protein GCM10007209_37390 [Haloferax sulfurifontis]